MAEIVRRSPVTGNETRVILDGDGGIRIFETQDVSPIIDAAQSLYSCFDEPGTSRKFKGDFHHVGMIPMTILLEIERTPGIDGEEKQRRVKAWLNDPANSKFRTKRARL